MNISNHYKFRYSFWAIGFLVALVSFAATSVFAQTTTGTIRGTVTGSGGAPIGSAQVVARNVSTGATRNTLSNDAGAYALVGLTPGTYDVNVRRIGSSPQSRTIVVQIGATQVQDFALTTQAAVLETQVVTAASGVETHTSEVATNVTQAQIAKLPTPSRNFLDLAALAPGVTVTEDRVNGQFRTVSAGGQPPSAVNLFIDGTSFKNELTQGGIAGQIVKDRIHFFGSYEGNYQNRANAVNIGTLPTGFPALDTVNLRQYNGNFISPFRENLFFGKLTDDIGNNQSAELSFSNRHETDIRDFGGNST